ncbi:acyltransferase family protein [Thioclava kandeliae]|uniref:Acyltransferase family protein n=1 Tax=Thioclava kandeliae TaxID=3070818 RepID=A0ABV1SLU1_9RHOB
MTNRLAVLDLWRVIAAFAVVTLHAQPFSKLAPTFNLIITQGATRLAVPFFLVASGYFLAQTFQRGRFRLWASKIFKMYVIWMVIYAPIWLSSLDGQDHVGFRAIKMLVIGYYHLWFLIALLLSASLLFVLVQKNREHMLIPTICAGFLFGFGMQYLYFYVPDGDILKIIKMGNLNRTFFGFAFPYLAVGYLISIYGEFRFFIQKNSVYFVLLGVALLFVEQAINVTFAERIYFSDNLVSVSILAPTAFVILLSSETSLSAIAKFLAPFSLAVYLVHIGILFILDAYTSFGNVEKWLLTCMFSAILAAFLLLPIRPLRWLIR